MGAGFQPAKPLASGGASPLSQSSVGWKKEKEHEHR